VLISGEKKKRSVDQRCFKIWLSPALSEFQARFLLRNSHV